MVFKEIAELYKVIMNAAQTLVQKAADSKKYTAFIIATVGLFTGFIAETSWLTVAVLYIGVEGGLDWKNSLIGDISAKQNSSLSDSEQERETASSSGKD